MQTKRCTKCSKIKPLQEFYSRAGKLGGRSDCKQCSNKRVIAFNKLPKQKEKQNIWFKQNRQLNRLAAMHVLGGTKCKQCGWDKDVRALQIDHVRGNGAEERKILSSLPMYRKIIRGEVNLQDYQVLCANCNTIKGAVNG